MARYRINPERSQVWFDGKSSLHAIHSNSDGLEGYIEVGLDANGHMDPAAKPSAKVSLPVARLTSGNKLEDRELQKRVNYRRYPTIEGVLEEMDRSDNDGTYRVTGDITFRGVERRQVGEMTLKALDDRTIQMAGSSRFDIRDFGMDPPKMLMLKVDPEVGVRVEIVAEKEG